MHYRRRQQTCCLKTSQQPYTETNKTLQRVHGQGNHLPNTTFEQATHPKQKALNESGYQYTLQYEPTRTNKRKNRRRSEILWYNPPLSKNFSTNIGQRFLSLVNKDYELSKIFIRNTIEICYSCMNNTICIKFT